MPKDPEETPPKPHLTPGTATRLTSAEKCLDENELNNIIEINEVETKNIIKINNVIIKHRRRMEEKSSSRTAARTWGPTTRQSRTRRRRVRRGHNAEAVAAVEEAVAVHRAVEEVEVPHLSVYPVGVR